MGGCILKIKQDHKISAKVFKLQIFPQQSHFVFKLFLFDVLIFSLSVFYSLFFFKCQKQDCHIFSKNKYFFKQKNQNDKYAKNVLYKMYIQCRYIDFFI